MAASAGAPQLSPGGLAACALLLSLPIVASRRLKIGLEFRLLVAAARAAAQLFVLGFVLLDPLFAARSPAVVYGYVLFMVLVAATEAWANAQYSYDGLFVHAVMSVVVGLSVVLTLALLVVLPHEVRPWQDPHFIIPIAGMMLGSAITATMIGVDRVCSEISAKSSALDLRLALGASLREALLPAIRTAFTAGLTPSLNQLSVVGLVSIPGMMTGQILGGQPPASAAVYQLMILYLLCSIACTCLSYSTFFVVSAIADTRFAHQRFHVDRLTKRKGAKQDIVLLLWSVVQRACGKCCRGRDAGRAGGAGDIAGPPPVVAGRPHEDPVEEPAPVLAVARLASLREAGAGQLLRVDCLAVGVPRGRLGGAAPLLREPVSFSLRPGEILCVTGRSGVGKSRLLRALVALDAPLGGRISLDPDCSGDSARAGTVEELGANVWRTQVLFVPQTVPPLAGTPAELLEEVSSFRAWRAHGSAPGLRRRPSRSHVRLEEDASPGRAPHPEQAAERHGCVAEQLGVAAACLAGP